MATRTLLAVLVLLYGLSGASAAANGVAVSGAWMRAMPPGAKNAAVYLTIENPGAVPDSLIGAETDLAERAEIHESAGMGTMAVMRPTGPRDIAPGASLALEPVGLHVMLIGMREPLAEGDTLTLTLIFENAGAVSVTVEVRAIGAMTH